MHAWKVLRIALEVLGVLLAGYVGFVTFVFLTYSGSLPVALLLAGYSALALALWALRRRRGAGLGRRIQFDCALITLVPAVWLTFLAIDERWPIRRPRVNAHGFGLTGGEANVLFLSWVHAALWLALVVLWSRRVARELR